MTASGPQNTVNAKSDMPPHDGHLPGPLPAPDPRAPSRPGLELGTGKLPPALVLSLLEELPPRAASVTEVA